MEERIGQFTREELAYATEKMPAETQARLKTLHKASRQQDKAWGRMSIQVLAAWAACSRGWCAA